MNFILFFLLSLVTAFGQTFEFDRDTNDWGNWGEGLGAHDPNVGLKQKGSLWISVDWGEVQTFHYNLNNLKPGLYKISAYVRAQNVQPNSDGSSFWHFYDGGSGTKNVFVSLDGNYDWRRIEYTAKVTKDNLSIWFRLRSPGQVWIDDISISTAAQPLEVKIAPAFPLKIVTPKQTALVSKKQTHVLLDFENSKLGQPFQMHRLNEKSHVGKFSSQKYYNINPQDYLKGNWSQFDRIELDVFNGTQGFFEIYLTLADNRSTNYWSQLNHKTHLAPGWNHLNFSLKQFIGERGSHRFLRSLDLSNIQKFFIISDPNSKLPASPHFYIDNLKLTLNPYPVPPKGVLAFDFTSHKDFEPSGFEKVTSQDLFTTDKGFGFIDPKFWRVEDAQWASKALRYSIGMLNGGFRIKLPNGSYRMQAVIERLGYWDPAFWKERLVMINGRPVLKESRSFAKDYLADLLQFEDTVPQMTDHPYNLYLKKIFKPIEFNFNVTNGYFDLEFEGDPTGISLNTLVVWPIGKNREAERFLNEMDTRALAEFDWMTRAIVPAALKLEKEEMVQLVESSLSLKPTDYRTQTQNSILLQAGFDERVYQMFQLRGKDVVTWQLSDLKGQGGTSIKSNSLEMFELVNQYISPDLNHETYLVGGKFLKKINNNRINVPASESRYLFFAHTVKTGTVPGNYRGSITFKSNDKVQEYPIELTVLPYDLPIVDFPVGFFGPEPIAHTYFEDKNLSIIRQYYRTQALRVLGESGFTTFAGLPEARLIQVGDDFTLDTKDLDEVLSAANRAGMSKTYFTYGGKFPQSILDVNSIPNGLSESVYFKKVSSLLKAYLSRPGMPKIVHTFSDEASGYSNRIQEDLLLAKKIKDQFPFLVLGGFGSKDEVASSELRQYFDFGFYSNVNKNQLASKSKWGSYNASPGNLDDPRFTFGPGLYFSRQNGLTHYLEWHSSSINNFPYYDLDGRESDITLFMPHTDGSLHPTLRFELAVEGLQSYRKLKLLEQSIDKGFGASVARNDAKVWLDLIKSGRLSSQENVLRPKAPFQFRSFSKLLDSHLNNLLK